MAKERRPKTLIGAYVEDAQWILDHRNDRPFAPKGERKRENTADVVERLVDKAEAKEK